MAHHAQDSSSEQGIPGYFGGPSHVLSYSLVLILLAMAFYYLLSLKTTAVGGHGAAHGADTHAAAAHPDGGEAHENKVAVAVAGHADSTGNFVYELGKMLTLSLPNNGGSLQVGELSTENKLYNFLNSSEPVDTTNGNWFEFTNVRFLSGGAVIDSSSQAQINNIAAIIKAFPKATFKVGGYTDNSGNADKNVVLSQQRADAVAAAFKKLGVPASALTGAKGYGPEHPIGDNATADGRAMNRRVAVNVKSK
jgi:outer membrane protein OmpA-like peptidoglycan-associated protein